MNFLKSDWKYILDDIFSKYMFSSEKDFVYNEFLNELLTVAFPLFIMNDVSFEEVFDHLDQNIYIPKDIFLDFIDESLDNKNEQDFLELCKIFKKQ